MYSALIARTECIIVAMMWFSKLTISLVHGWSSVLSYCAAQYRHKWFVLCVVAESTLCELTLTKYTILQ